MAHAAGPAVTMEAAMTEPLPGWLRWAAERALLDFQRPTPVDLRLRYGIEEDGLEILWVDEAGEPGTAGYMLPAGLRGTELLVWMAGWLQEQVVPETRAARGEARPACPGHAHPARAEDVGGEAWWTCPLSGQRIAPVGHAV